LKQRLPHQDTTQLRYNIKADHQSENLHLDVLPPLSK